MEENKGAEVVDDVTKNVAAGEGQAQTDVTDKAANDGTEANNQGADDGDSFIDDSLLFFENGSANGGGNPTGDNAVTLSKEQHDKLLEKASMYDAISSSPAALAVVKHFQAGGTVEELFKRYDNTDYTQLPPETLYRRKMAEDKAKYGLTDEEVEEAVQDFLGMSSVQQKREIAEYRNILEANRGKGLGELNKALDDAMERQRQSGERFMSDFDNILNEWVKKKKFFTVDFDQTAAEKIKSTLIKNNGLPIFDKDGNLDAREVFKMLTAYMYLPEIVKNSRVKGEQSGMRRVIQDAAAVPSQVQSGSSSPTVSSPSGSSNDDAIKKAMEKKGWVPPTAKPKS